MIYRRGGRKLLLIIPLAILTAALFGFIVMSLWNVVVPAVFGGKIITFWQALGLLVLSRILVGGFFRRGGFGDRQRARKAIWERLTPEEREKLRAGMRGRGCAGGAESQA
jgi:hypothetical protein